MKKLDYYYLNNSNLCIMCACEGFHCKENGSGPLPGKQQNHTYLKILGTCNYEKTKFMNEMRVENKIQIVR